MSAINLAFRGPLRSGVLCLRWFYRRTGPQNEPSTVWVPKAESDLPIVMRGGYGG